MTALVDDLLEVVLDTNPVGASLLGIRGRDDRLPDFSEAGEDALRRRLRDVMAPADTVDPTTLTAAEQVTLAVVRHQSTAMLDRLDARAVEYTVTDYPMSPLIQIIVDLPMVSLAEPAHADGYLARLAALPALLSTVAERHRTGIAAGRLPVRHLVRSAIAFLDRQVASGMDAMRRPQPPADGAAFDAERDRLLADVASPALAGYRNILAAEVEPHGRPADRAGLCWLPGGDEIYRRMIRLHTTTSRSAEDLHQVGLDIVARLGEEYAEIGAQAFGTSDTDQIFERLRNDPALRWSDGDELLAAARAAIRRAEAAAPQWFGRLPSHSCAVEPVPAAEAPGAPGALYLSPAMDGTRPGTYFANTYRAEERMRYACEPTAFHEAVPGHHLQDAIAQQLPDLPLLRRLPLTTAYGEGWALYAERLADEMGLYTDPVARLGMLTLDSIRAARLVVDTGLHAKGWSREQVVEYLRTNTVMPQVEIDAETDRYIADPGQALAYMVGRLEIQRIRGDAQRTLGDRFDIRAFHDVLLGHGELPLDVLDQVVRDWTRG